MLYRLCFHSLLLPLLLLAGCPGYDVKINERVVYTADPLFDDFLVPDAALSACIEETITTESVTAVANLTSLNCSHAGIENLQGLATFTGLQRLRLSSNKVRNLVELDKLTDLRELYLDNNRIVDPVPLYQLSRLTYLDLSGNPEMQCPRSAGFSGVNTILLPKHCS